MKKILSIAMLLMVALTMHAQQDVTKFLGIPVDGTKSEIIRKLKEKGFTTNPYHNEMLQGEFNGTNVNIHVQTVNNKAWRIIVSDETSVDESMIKIRYNNLCSQFENNSKYVAPTDYTIPESEDISYEMNVHNKQYQATYYQRTTDTDIADMNKLVWFTISKNSYKYYIVMFYENGHNQANGDDL